LSLIMADLYMAHSLYCSLTNHIFTDKSELHHSSYKELCVRITNGAVLLLLTVLVLMKNKLASQYISEILLFMFIMTALLLD
jgi:hypothetical protein